MASYGWMINLTGKTLPVYSENGSIGPSKTQIGKITKNECFVDGNVSENPWEGDGKPVIFLNTSHTMTWGLLANSESNLVNFSDYASDGTSWVSVNTLERKVQYATEAYYADGCFFCALPAGSRVWLTKNCGAGENQMNYIAVTSVQPAGDKKYTFAGNGFIDLTYDSRWVNVGSILLRKV
ncbi:MAG: hypothetical protein NC517_00550 [Firmicutes bacterium]|nr:hypothetical protein [Bacillota bacterium]